MTTREEALEYGLSLPGTYQDAPFRDDNWQLVRVKGSKKAFLWTYEREGLLNLNVKADPEWRDFWRSAYEAVIPGWHQNKEHWNTIILDGSIPEKDIRRMIKESYDLVTDSPSKRIYEAVKRIPKGKVASYSQVAAMAGNPRMCRAVGNALHHNPDPRIFRATGLSMQRVNYPVLLHSVEPTSRRDVSLRTESRLSMEKSIWKSTDIMRNKRYRGLLHS